MEIQIPRIILNIYKFYTFVSTRPSKMFLQILIWIAFSIPFLFVSLALILLEYIRFAVFQLCNLLTLTVILIPIAYALNFVLINIVFYITNTILYLTTIVIMFPIAMLAD